MSDNLKPCPCCGSEDVGPIFIFLNKQMPRITQVAATCKACGVRTEWGRYFPDALKTWNQRQGEQNETA